ncbi:lactococcin 972 family bacteriocin [Streptomyces sp. NPDC003860]
MKIVRKSIAFAAAAAALTAGTLVPAASASAASAQSEEKEWGMVAIPIDPDSSVTPMTIKEVGGGTWSYGTQVTSSGYKRCYSNYLHGSVRHSSTAVLANGTHKDWADAGSVSNASVVAGHAYTCYAYWGKE